MRPPFLLRNKSDEAFLATTGYDVAMPFFFGSGLLSC